LPDAGTARKPALVVAGMQGPPRFTGDLDGLDICARRGRSNWCGEACIAKLSIDTTIK
jgi:hypothetical protein